MEKADALALLGIDAGGTANQIERAYDRGVRKVRKQFEEAQLKEQEKKITREQFNRTEKRLKGELTTLGDARALLLTELGNTQLEPLDSNLAHGETEGSSSSGGRPDLLDLSITGLADPDDQQVSETVSIAGQPVEPATAEDTTTPGQSAGQIPLMDGQNGGPNEEELTKKVAETTAAGDQPIDHGTGSEEESEIPKPQSTDDVVVKPSGDDKSDLLKPPQPFWRNPWLEAAGAAVIVTALILVLWPHAPPAPATGKLIVNTIPAQAEVVLDDASRGVTPLLLDAVSPGDHRLTIRLNGYEPAELIVSVKRGEEATLPPVSLIRKKSSPAPNSTSVVSPSNSAVSPANPVETAGERYPQTRLRVLTEADMADLDYAQLRYAINEIYARHGDSFPKEPDVEAQFRKFAWYHPVPGRTEAQIEGSLSPLEKYNIGLLARMRDQKRPK